MSLPDMKDVPVRGVREINPGRKVFIKQNIGVIGQTLLLSFSRPSHRRYTRTFCPTQTSGRT